MCVYIYICWKWAHGSLRLRAVLAAARFCDTLREEGLEGQSGVATGTVWCGVSASGLHDRE